MLASSAHCCKSLGKKLQTEWNPCIGQTQHDEEAIASSLIHGLSGDSVLRSLGLLLAGNVPAFGTRRGLGLGVAYAWGIWDAIICAEMFDVPQIHERAISTADSAHSMNDDDSSEGQIVLASVFRKPGHHGQSDVANDPDGPKSVLCIRNTVLNTLGTWPGVPLDVDSLPSLIEWFVRLTSHGMKIKVLQMSSPGRAQAIARAKFHDLARKYDDNDADSAGSGSAHLVVPKELSSNDQSLLNFDGEGVFFATPTGESLRVAALMMLQWMVRIHISGDCAQ